MGVSPIIRLRWLTVPLVFIIGTLFSVFLRADGGGELSFAIPETESSAETESEDSDRNSFGFRLIPSVESQKGTMGLDAKQNVWGRFNPGSWVRYERTLVSGTAAVPVKSITEMKLSLNHIGKEGYELNRSVTVRTGGRELPRPAETISFNFFDSVLDPTLEFHDLSPDNIELKRLILDLPRPVPCYVRIFNRKAGNRREETKVWYSPVIFPHILRQESQIFILPESPGENETLYRSSVSEVKVGSLNFRFGLVRDWVTELVVRDAAGVMRQNTVTYHSVKIPGGILAEQSVEFDASGNQILQNDLHLLDYYTVPR